MPIKPRAACLCLALLCGALALMACSPITTASPAAVAPSATPTAAPTAAPTSTLDAPSPTPVPPPATFTAVVPSTTPSVTSVPPTNAPTATNTPRPPTATPTNTPRPLPTAPIVVSQPFDGGGIPQACFQSWATLPTTAALMFRVIAYDSNTRPPPCVIQKDGSGIANVEFRFLKIVGGNEVEVYKKPSPEQNAPYCAFSDTNGVCNVWVLAQNNNRWPNGAPITNGDYVLRVKVNGKDGNSRNGKLNFTIKIP